VRRPAAILLCLLSAAVAGCQTGFDEERENAKPLKVAHAMGESKVPGQARRPLALTAGAVDTALALDVTPVGAALPGARLPAYLRRRAEGMEVLPPLKPGSFRRPAALDPDVILGSRERQARLYYGLRKVAPTVMSEGGGGGGGAWKLTVRLFGEGLGRTNAAERLLIGWDSTAADARRRIGPRKPSVAVVRAVWGGLRLAGLDSFPGRLLADAGLGDGLGEDSWRPLSPAQLKRLNADVVLVSAPPGVEVPAVAGALRVDDALWWDGEGLLAARAAMRQLVHAAVR